MQMSALFAKLVVVIPVCIFRDSTQPKQVFGPGLGPAHARQIEAVFDQVTTGIFDDA
jgi:hypothetical protein